MIMIDVAFWHSVNENARIDLVISVCANSNHLISLTPPPPPIPELPQILDIYGVFTKLWYFNMLRYVFSKPHD